MKICCVIPSRGFIFADTIKTTFLNPELPKDTIFKIITNIPLPECHNECVKQALQTDCTHILFVENDIVIPAGGITEMIRIIESGARHVAIDYGMVVNPSRNGNSTIVEDKGKVMWTGFGCTMFDRTIFEKEFAYPYFTDAYQYRILGQNPLRYFKETKKGKYGYLDIHWGIEANERGITLNKVKGYRCKHLRIPEFEQYRKQDNNGLYNIREIT